MKFKLFVFTLLLIGFSTLDFLGGSSKKDVISNKEKMVIAVDTLRANYFVNKGEPTGYQLELLKLYTKKFNTPFEMLSVGDKNERITMLLNGTADIVVFSEGSDSLCTLLKARKDICASIPMDDKNQSVWIIKSGNEHLINSINLWISELKDTQLYCFWQIRYFDRSYFGSKGRISPYDHWFKRYSAEIGWDWRLLAALSYQESKFNPEVESRCGAYGLMQVMPETAMYIGVDSIEHPENNIRAGVKLIKWLQRQLEKEEIPEEEQLKFVLSAYNAGIGRVEDCRNFAYSQGKSPDIWDEVKKVVPLMSKPEYYEGEYIRRGKFRGDETLRFVDEVLGRYQHYKNLVPS
ncbi:MAG: transglycosylase SLT domain-containing protein [Prevotellaceae bacterium]|jgi:membrane-bound lytic murein transglycosylase F|nr:transglycosylase SLT domain-containing protein [Prevotellaceae bacterium]